MLSNVVLGFQPFWFTRCMAIPYWDEACAAPHSWVHTWNLRSLTSSQALSSFPSFPLRTASDGKLDGSLWSRVYSFSRHTQSESESSLPMITGIRSDESFCWGGMFHAYVATMCTKLRTICYTWERVRAATGGFYSGWPENLRMT